MSVAVILRDAARSQACAGCVYLPARPFPGDEDTIACLNRRIPVADQADVLNCALCNGPETCHEIDARGNIDIRVGGEFRPGSDVRNGGRGGRQAIQSDLAWVGQYNGAITSEVNERMVAAIKEFQKERGGKPTGVLNPQERGALAETARRRQDNVGWKIVTDAGSGVRLGIPTKLVPQQSSDANGAKWSSSTGTIQIQLARRKEANSATAKLADQERREPAGRKVDYSVVKPDFFVLSGTQGLKKFYVRGHFKGDEVRILTILYDQATEGTVEPVVIAMSSAFNPFPAGAQ